MLNFSLKIILDKIAVNIIDEWPQADTSDGGISKRLKYKKNKPKTANILLITKRYIGKPKIGGPVMFTFLIFIIIHIMIPETVKFMTKWSAAFKIKPILMNKLDVENKAAANNANIFVKNNYNDREGYLETTQLISG